MVLEFKRRRDRHTPRLCERNKTTFSCVRRFLVRTREQRIRKGYTSTKIMLSLVHILER